MTDFWQLVNKTTAELKESLFLFNKSWSVVQDIGVKKSANWGNVLNVILQSIWNSLDGDTLKNLVISEQLVSIGCWKIKIRCHFTLWIPKSNVKHCKKYIITWIGLYLRFLLIFPHNRIIITSKLNMLKIHNWILTIQVYRNC